MPGWLRRMWFRKVPEELLTSLIHQRWFEYQNSQCRLLTTLDLKPTGAADGPRPADSGWLSRSEYLPTRMTEVSSGRVLVMAEKDSEGRWARGSWCGMNLIDGVWGLVAGPASEAEIPARSSTLLPTEFRMEGEGPVESLFLVIPDGWADLAPSGDSVRCWLSVCALEPSPPKAESQPSRDSVVVAAVGGEPVNALKIGRGPSPPLCCRGLRSLSASLMRAPGRLRSRFGLRSPEKCERELLAAVEEELWLPLECECRWLV